MLGLGDELSRGNRSNQMAISRRMSIWAKGAPRTRSQRGKMRPAPFSTAATSNVGGGIGRGKLGLVRDDQAAFRGDRSGEMGDRLPSVNMGDRLRAIDFGQVDRANTIHSGGQLTEMPLTGGATARYRAPRMIFRRPLCPCLVLAAVVAGCGGATGDGEDAGASADASASDAVADVGRADGTPDRIRVDSNRDGGGDRDADSKGESLDTGVNDAAQDADRGDADAPGADAQSGIEAGDTSFTGDRTWDRSADDVSARDAADGAAVADANTDGDTPRDRAITDDNVSDDRAAPDPSDAIGIDVIDDAASDDGATNHDAADAGMDGFDPDAWSHLPRATISLQLEEYDPMDPIHGNKRCPPYRHWINVPYQRDRSPAANSQQLDSTAALATAIDGLDLDKVACAVAANGAAFAVQGDATGFAINYDRRMNPVVVTIRIPSIASGATSAAGRIAFQDDTTAGQVYSSDECVFSVEGGSLGVATGRVWGSVVCENITSATPEAACRVGKGYFRFENCAE
jgi:hypothetical protein